MAHRGALDRLRGHFYSLLAVVAAALMGCAGAIHPIAPLVLPSVPAARVAAWVGAVAPRHAVLYELHWVFETQQGRSAGRANARIAPPDTLRFDYRGPFGRAGAAVVIGDSSRWARPEADARNLVPAAPLFWLALGAPQAPPADAQVFGSEENARRVWRYVRGRESMDVVFEPGDTSRLLAQWRRDDELVGTCEVHLNAQRLPLDAMLTFPKTAARFSFTVEHADTLATHDPTIWWPPR